MQDMKIFQRLILDMTATIKSLYHQYNNELLISINEPVENSLNMFRNEIEDLKQQYYHLAVDLFLFKYPLEESTKAYDTISDVADRCLKQLIIL